MACSPGTVSGLTNKDLPKKAPDEKSQQKVNEEEV